MNPFPYIGFNARKIIEPGEGAQWQKDLDWLWRMDEWFEEKHIQAKARRVGMAVLRAARGDEE